MQTLYIDVYFLINFTVDLLSLHFASRFSKVFVSGVRLIFASLIGAAYACTVIFLPENALILFFFTAAALIIISLIAAKGITLLRRIKLIIAFFIFLLMIGGIVYFAFCIADKYIPTEEFSGGHNRGFLLLAVGILLGFGMLKMVFSMYSGVKSEKTVRLNIEMLGESVDCDAFVDTGNLLRDPIDSTAVMLIKRRLAEKLFADGVPDITAGNIPSSLRRYIRVIPINKNGTAQILFGIRADRVRIFEKNKVHDLRLTLVIDEEGGTFAGYDALFPAAALEGI